MKYLLSISAILILSLASGQFTPSTISIGGQCIGASGGTATLLDIDSDGDLDFISSFSNTVYYRLNDGNGNYSELEVFTVSTGMWRIIVIDIDQDGLNDIVSYSQDYYVKWHKNNGDGSYASPISLFLTDQFYSFDDISAVDLDNDGDLDIIGTYNNYNTSFCWFENLGNSTFASEVVVNTGTFYVTELRVCDINQDGLMDVLYWSYNNARIACCLNLGGGVFGPEILVANIGGTSSLFAFDKDNDGDLDIGYASEYYAKISWFENISSSSFGPEQFVQTSLVNLKDAVKTDIDNDGDDDIAAIVQNNLVYYENQGGGSFSTTIILQPMLPLDEYIKLNVADINSDGENDLYAGIWNFMWYRKTGSATFDPSVPISTASRRPQSAVAVDLDNDGKVDIASSALWSFNASWYQNTGNTTFTTAKTLILNTSENRYIKYADLNNDGLIDIVTNSAGNVGWIRNLGNGLFDTYVTLVAWTLNTMPNYEDFELGDFDNDGNIDIVLSRASGFKWLKNLGNNQFEPSVNATLVTGSMSSYGDIELIDSNNDGWLDVLYTTPNGIALQQNLGNGTFGAELIITTLCNQTRAISKGDVDNDGLIDIVSISYNDNKIAWYKNLGNNQFDVQQVLSTQITQPTELALADLNGDGLIDIIAGKVSEVSWFENLGNAQYGAKTVIMNNLANLTSISVTEIDGDGDLDILITTDDDNGIRMLSNNYIHDYQVSGRLFYDKNQNGIFDNDDTGIPNAAVLTAPSSSSSFTYANGVFNTIFNDTIGLYTIYPEDIPNWSVASTPSSYQVNVTPNFINQSDLDFGFFPDTLFEEVNPMLIAAGANCNDTIIYWVDIVNSGTVKNSGVIELKLDPLNSYFASSIAPDSILGNNIYWNYDSLEVFDHLQFNVQVVLPDFQSMGTELRDSLNVSILDVNGSVSSQFQGVRNQILVCAYDPNDKTVSPKGTTSQGYIPMNTEWLEYIIRFQNTGTSTAQHVRIDDVLDNNIDYITILSSSHSMHVTVDESNMVSFKFDNINLPDSSSNVLGSQGYVLYKAKLKNNLPEYTQIENVAEIYFDQNPPIITNSVLNTLKDETASIENVLDDTPTFQIYPNPFSEFIIVKLFNGESTNYTLDVYNMVGQKLIEKIDFHSNQIKLFKSDLGSGLLYFKIYSNNEELIHVVKVISF